MLPRRNEGFHATVVASAIFALVFSTGCYEAQLPHGAGWTHQQDYLKWCVLSPPIDLDKPEVRVDAPLSQWVIPQRFESWSGCERFLDRNRFQSWFPWRGFYPVVVCPAMGCDKGPNVTSRAQYTALAREAWDSSVCISIDDELLKDNPAAKPED